MFELIAFFNDYTQLIEAFEAGGCTGSTGSLLTKVRQKKVLSSNTVLIFAASNERYGAST